MSETLKPCPFCGGSKLRIRHSDIEGWIAHVECTECDDMLGPMSQYKYDDKEDASEDAIKVWNRRTPDPSHDAMIEERDRLREEEQRLRKLALDYQAHYIAMKSAMEKIAELDYKRAAVNMAATIANGIAVAALQGDGR